MFQWGALEKVMTVMSQLLHRVKEVGFDAEGVGETACSICPIPRFVTEQCPRTHYPLKEGFEAVIKGSKSLSGALMFFW